MEVDFWKGGMELDGRIGWNWTELDGIARSNCMTMEKFDDIVYNCM
jgi:hypothetical protein